MKRAVPLGRRTEGVVVATLDRERPWTRWGMAAPRVASRLWGHRAALARAGLTRTMPGLEVWAPRHLELAAVVGSPGQVPGTRAPVRMSTPPAPAPCRVQERHGCPAAPGPAPFPSGSIVRLRPASSYLHGEWCVGKLHICAPLRRGDAPKVQRAFSRPTSSG